MNTHYIAQSLKWIRSQIIGILIAIIALLVAATYAAPYSPSAFGYAKYDLSCGAYITGFGANYTFCVRLDTTTGEASCKYSSDLTNSWGTWNTCHAPSGANSPW